MLADYMNPAIGPEMHAYAQEQENLIPESQPRRSTRRSIVLHSDGSSSDEEIQADRAANSVDPENPDQRQSVRDRVAQGEVPMDVLARQRGQAPVGAYILTEQEAQREIANSILFCFMDVLSIGAWIVCLAQDHEPCDKPLTAWYTCNAIWAAMSLAFLAYYTCTQLRNNFQTKRSIAITYGIESGYLILSIWAWIVLASKDPGDQCKDNASGVMELLVDMIILLYMRSLRLLSIVLFIIICGPLLLICWYKNRPIPPESPVEVIKQLVRVKVSEFKTLRAMNYRHAPTPRSSAALSESGSASDLNGSYVASNPYEGQGVGQAALESCCICMEDFESAPESQRAVDNELGAEAMIVVLPCKSHFFHEECISQWIQKQPACPICRDEITLAKLKEQNKEVKSLLEQAKKANPLESSSLYQSIVSDSENGKESPLLQGQNDKYQIND